MTLRPQPRGRGGVYVCVTIKKQPPRVNVLAAVIPALLLSVATAAPAAAGTSSRVALPSPNSSSLLTTSSSTEPLDPTLQVALRVYLAPRPGLAAAATAASDPRSPAYAHFLTTAQYQQDFAPTTAQSTTVRDWLSSQGMTITAATSHYVAVTSTVAQADAAFATTISAYDSFSPGVVGGFSVPAALGSDILTVTGIDQIDVPFPSGSDKKDGVTEAGPETAPRSAAQQAEQKAVANARTAAHASTTTPFQCSQYWGQYTGSIPEAYGHTTAPTQLCGYTPDQIRQAYGIASSPYTGEGATIAIISTGRKPLMEADANEYFESNGETGFAPGQFKDVVLPTVASTCAGVDLEPDPEEPIDVESAHIAAPDARIVSVATDCDQSGDDGTFLQESLDGASAVVDRHLADIVSGSFGVPEPFDAPADMAAWDPVLEQGAVEGIGFDFSSGDSGDLIGEPSGAQDYDLRNAQFPATDPWATAIGGTSTAIGPDGTVVGDYAWGDDFATIDPDGTGYTQAPPGTYSAGSGGGVSSEYAEPQYQQAAVPAALSTDGGTTPASRVIPDISADAGLPWLIGWTGAVSDGAYAQLPAGGGTSASAPLIAGLEADAIQAAGHPLGFINPALYSMRGSDAIRDILPVDPADPPILFGEQTGYAGIDTTQLAVLGEDGTLTAGVGYDAATGLGAPTASFVTSLAKH